MYWDDTNSQIYTLLEQKVNNFYWGAILLNIFLILIFRMFQWKQF